MTLLELVTHLRESILDDVGGTGVAWADITQDDDSVAQLRWSNEELTRLITQAQRNACRSADLIKDAYSFTPTSIVSGTQEYALDSTIYRVKQARLTSTGKSLIETSIEDLIDSRDDWTASSGTPTHYALDLTSGNIVLYPNPDANDTMQLVVYRYPLLALNWETAETQTCELRDEHQIPMLYGAAYLAYQKDEANTFDPNRSEYFRQMFEREFTVSTAYSESRRTRDRGRAVRYRDLY